MVWYAHQNVFETNKGYVCFIVDESASVGLTVIGYKRATNRGIYLFKRGNDESDLYMFRVETDDSYSYTKVITDTTDSALLKVKSFTVGLANLSWSGGVATADIAVNMSGIVATIPVVESVTGYTLTCRQNTGLSSSMDTVTCQVWSSSTSLVPTYGTLRLYVFYTG